MIRTTVDLVKEIIDTSLTDALISGYINTASLMVDNSSITTLSDDTLAEMERWLTAHLISITRERMTVKETVGDASVQYSDKKFGDGLKASNFGQMVLALDTSGTFARMGYRTATITAVKSFD